VKIHFRFSTGQRTCQCRSKHAIVSVAGGDQAAVANATPIPETPTGALSALTTLPKIRSSAKSRILEKIGFWGRSPLVERSHFLEGSRRGTRVARQSLSEHPFRQSDFDSLTGAQQVAKQNAGTGRPVFIYNDQAKLIVRYGSWH
jgi:hypothetical protein